MRRARRTFVPSEETLRLFENAVSAGKRSAVVRELLALWVQDRYRARMRADLIECCREMWDDYEGTARAWAPTDGTLWRALEH